MPLDLMKLSGLSFLLSENGKALVERRTLLQIPARRIIVDARGEICGYELHSPFAYLAGLNEKAREALLLTGRVRLTSY